MSGQHPEPEVGSVMMSFRNLKKKQEPFRGKVFITVEIELIYIANIFYKKISLIFWIFQYLAIGY